MLFSSVRALGLGIDFNLACGPSGMVLEMLFGKYMYVSLVLFSASIYIDCLVHCFSLLVVLGPQWYDTTLAVLSFALLYRDSQLNE